MPTDSYTMPLFLEIGLERSHHAQPALTGAHTEFHPTGHQYMLPTKLSLGLLDHCA